MITYNAEGVKLPKIGKRDTTRWIKAVAASHNRKVGEIGYLFVDDEKILEVNNEYLGHDYYTDVITFDYCEGNVLNGDIVISLDTVRTNAEKFGKTYEEETFSCHYPWCTPSLWYQRQSARRTRDNGRKRKQSLSIALRLCFAVLIILPNHQRELL